MRSSKTATVFGIGMIIGSIPCTLVGGLLLHLAKAVEEGRAAGRDVGFDVIGVVMTSYFAFLIALASCVAGLIYFGYSVLLRRNVALQPWHRFAIAYSVIQMVLAALYISTR
jgi:hypothetical protein